MRKIQKIQKIGILSAMDFETERIRESLKNEKTEEKNKSIFYTGTIGEKEIFLCVMGIGKVNAAISTQSMIDNFGVEALLHIGVAGALSKDMRLFDLVLADSLHYHDFDADIMRKYLPFTDVFYPDARLFSLAEDALLKNGEAFHKGGIVTGDSFIDSGEKREHILSCFPHALCVDMESASVAHCCYLNHTPFFIARSISDFSDNEDIYQENKKEAAQRSADLILHMCRNIDNI